MAKAHTITIRTTHTEEYMVKGAKNAKEAIEKFKEGDYTFLARSEVGEDQKPKVRVSDERDIQHDFGNEETNKKFNF